MNFNEGHKGRIKSNKLHVLEKKKKKTNFSSIKCDKPQFSVRAWQDLSLSIVCSMGKKKITKCVWNKTNILMKIVSKKLGVIRILEYILDP